MSGRGGGGGGEGRGGGGGGGGEVDVPAGPWGSHAGDSAIASLSISLGRGASLPSYRKHPDAFQRYGEGLC